MKYIVCHTDDSWAKKQRRSNESCALVATVQEAIDNARDGDKIIIGPMTSDESLDLRPLIGKRVEIRGEEA